jgi:5'-nucleotidase
MAEIARCTVIGPVTLEQYAYGGFRYFNADAGPETYSLRILHTNDHHARIDPVVETNVTPNRNHGGIARRKTLIDRYRSEARRNRLPMLLLDAGDVFQGTLYFNVYKGMADLDFYRRLRYHAMTIGNHEFDNGQADLAKFIDGAQDKKAPGASFPVLSANITVDATSPLKGKIKPRIIRRAGGQRIGIFGLTTDETPELSSPGAGVTFTDPLAAAEEQVAALTKLGVNKIIALTHLGFMQDQKLAQQVKGISLVIGGHSHTPLGPQPGAAHEYPTIESAPDGRKVLIVTNWEWGRWLGVLAVGFDDNGVVSNISGEPVEVLAASTDGQAPAIVPHLDFEALIDDYNDELDALRAKQVGATAVTLDGATVNIRSRETNLGNLIADAMLAKTAGDSSQIAIMNGGGIRASINEGDITFGEVLEVLPFGSTVARVKLTGAQVLEALENGVSRVGQTEGTGRFAQVGGIRYTYNASRPAGSRIVSAEVKSGDSFAALDPSATYNVVTNSFLMTGGDGYAVFAKGTDQLDIGFVLADAVAEYITANTPINPQPDGRISAQIATALPVFLED